MNLILDGVPKSLPVGGVEYPIHWDFRTSILFELLVQSDEISENDKVVEALKLYYGDHAYKIPAELIGEAINKILWFYSCGKSESDSGKDRRSEKSEGEQKIVYSFEYDDHYIFAAFLSQYGIDLAEVENLHWWKFRAMFESLKDDEKIVKIMGYRSADTSKMTKEQRTFYGSMKRLYALPLSAKKAQYNKDLIEALKNGNDLTALLGHGGAE